MAVGNPRHGTMLDATGGSQYFVNARIGPRVSEPIIDPGFRTVRTRGKPRVPKIDLRQMDDLCHGKSYENVG